jgi:dihydrofolate synthase / folylpolyglutamate synthase
VAVVGTNGKTSTAIYLARILTRAGIRAGVTVSPHLEWWSERVLVDGEAVDEAALAAELERLDGLVADPADLRFFDLLALAAVALFSRAEVEVAVCEAGLGGRLDAVRVLEPELVVLTTVGLDHTELLGDTLEQVLREKLGAAPPGATIVTGPDLSVQGARALEPRDESFLETNRRLAQLAARTLGVEPAEIELAVRGRLERGRSGDVDWILDAAHNEQAWRRLLADLDGEAGVAVLSVSADKDARALRGLLARFDAVVATVAWPGRSIPAEELARAVRAEEAIPDPVEAVGRGLELARARDTRLLVFGSAYLHRHALAALRATVPAGSS